MGAMSNKTFRVARIVYFTDLTRNGARVIPLGSLSEVLLPEIHGLALTARAKLLPEELELVNPLLRDKLANPFTYLQGEFSLAWKDAMPGVAIEYLAKRHASSLSVLAPTDYAESHWLLSRLFVREETVEAKLSAAVDGEFSELLKIYGSLAASPQKVIQSEERAAA